MYYTTLVSFNHVKAVLNHNYKKHILASFSQYWRQKFGSGDIFGYKVSRPCVSPEGSSSSTSPVADEFIHDYVIGPGTPLSVSAELSSGKG